MFIPGEVLWPTAALGSIIALIFGGVAALRLLPPSKARRLEQREREAFAEMEARVAELDQLHHRVAELEERVDFAERLLSKQRDERRLPPAEE
jgi:Tfp pilus assembly protein PilO